MNIKVFRINTNTQAVITIVFLPKYYINHPVNKDPIKQPINNEIAISDYIVSEVGSNG